MRWLLGKAYGFGEVGMKKRGRMLGRPARAGSSIEGPISQVKEEFRFYLESHWDLQLDFKQWND